MAPPPAASAPPRRAMSGDVVLLDAGTERSVWWRPGGLEGRRVWALTLA